MSDEQTTQVRSPERLRHLEVLRTIQRELLTNTAPDLTALLARIGDVTAADHVYLYDVEPEATLRRRARWARDIDHPERVSFERIEAARFDPGFIPTMTRGDAYERHIEDEALSDTMRATLEALGITAVVFLPIHADGMLRSCLGFDRVEDTSQWEARDLDLLTLTAQAFAMVLERQQARARARLARLSLDEFAQQSEDVVWVSDLRGEIEFVSRSYEENWGLPSDELEAERASFLNHVHPDDREELNAYAERPRHAPEEIQYRLIVNGQTRWIHDRSFPLRDEDGTLRGHGGISTDVTELHLARQELADLNARLEERVRERTAALEQAQRELQRSRARYKGLFEQSPDAILLLSSEGVVQEVNHAALDLFASPREALVGQPLTALYPQPAAREVITRRVEMAQEIGATHFELHHHPGAQAPFVCEVSLTRLELPGEVLLQWLCRDRTAQHVAEVALEESQQWLRQAQKMDALGRLASGIAHDFNNILAVILSYAEFLEAGLATSDDGALLADAREISMASRRASELTRQLLTFSRQQPHELVESDLNDIIRDMQPMLQRLLGADVTITPSLSAQLPPILVDRGQIEQVLLNLVVNARDAMPDGGQLHIKTSHAREFDGVELRVEDTGVGMTPEVLERACEPFFTTRRAKSATGLGLATTYGIVTQHGGDLEFSSQPNVGTTATVRLPRAWARGEVSQPEQEEEEPRFGDETVLLVENAPQVRRLIERILEARGWRLLSASSPREALALSQEHAGEIALLLTDVVLPEMSGGALAGRLIKQHPELRVLYMSGHLDEVVSRHIQSDARGDILKKPFSPRELARAVWRQLREPRPRQGA